MRISITGRFTDFEGTEEELLARMTRGVTNALLQMERAAKQNLQGDARGKHLMSSLNTAVQVNGLRVDGALGVGTATGISDESGTAADNFGIYVHEGTGKFGNGAGRGQSHGTVPWPFIGKDGLKHWTFGQEANPFLENAYNSEGERCRQIIANAITGG